MQGVCSLVCVSASTYAMHCVHANWVCDTEFQKPPRTDLWTVAENDRVAQMQVFLCFARTPNLKGHCSVSLHVAYMTVQMFASYPDHRDWTMLTEGVKHTPQLHLCKLIKERSTLIWRVCNPLEHADRLPSAGSRLCDPLVGLCPKPGTPFAPEVLVLEG